MKTLVLSLATLLFSSIGFSQKVSFGISLGVSSDKLLFENDFSLNDQVNSLTSDSRAGFNIGIHGLIRVANRVNLSPQLLLAFSEHSLSFDFVNDEINERIIENVFIRMPIDIHLELLKGKTSLYLISGVEYALNITDNIAKGNLLDIEPQFWSGRLGIGLRKDFNHFSMSPELTFVKSLKDISKDNVLPLNQVITNLGSSIVGFNLKFQGLLSNS